MPITVDGLASGMDTKEIVNKLVEIEKQPLKRLEQNQKELKYENNALTEMRKRVNTLHDSLRKLTRFEAAFEMKTIESEPGGYISGVANKNAPAGEYQLHVKQLASALSFASDRVDKDTVLPKGTITVAGKARKFRGGSIQSLRDFLNEHYSKHIRAKAVNVTSDKTVLIIDNLKEGLDNIVKIEDPSGIFGSINMFNGSTALNTDTSETTRTVNKPVSFSRAALAEVTPSKLEITADKRGVSIAGDGSYRMKSQALSKNSTLKKLLIKAEELKAETSEEHQQPEKEAQKEEHSEDTTPTTLLDGPVQTLNIGGIEVNTYNIERIRDKEQVEEQTEEPEVKKADYGLVLRYKPVKPGQKAVEEKISLKNKTGRVEIKTDPGLLEVDFYSSGTDALFSDAYWVLEEKSEPVTDPDSALAAQKARFPNLLKPAGNAIIGYEGLDLERTTNTDIADIIEGVTLNLEKESEGPVTARIKHNNEKALEQINNFVKAYNDLLKFTHEASKTAKVEEAGKYNEMRQETGILMSNAAVRSMVSGLRMKVSSAYPAVREPYIRVISAIGISTGPVGSKWSDIEKGYLQVDENQLAEMLRSHPEAVGEFFAVDTNGDRRQDNGFAITVMKYLEPYSRFTGGVFTAQIKSNKNKMEQLSEEMNRVEEHAVIYEQKMREKFGHMESAIKKQKSTGNFLRQKLGGGGGK